MGSTFFTVQFFNDNETAVRDFVVKTLRGNFAPVSYRNFTEATFTTDRFDAYILLHNALRQGLIFAVTEMVTQDFTEKE